jgi:hypothetical protein
VLLVQRLSAPLSLASITNPPASSSLFIRKDDEPSSLSGHTKHEQLHRHSLLTHSVVSGLFQVLCFVVLNKRSAKPPTADTQHTTNTDCGAETRQKQEREKGGTHLLNQYILPLCGSMASNHPPPMGMLEELDRSRVFCEEVEVKLPVGDGAL